jgi:hypothetical protein
MNCGDSPDGATHIWIMPEPIYPDFKVEGSKGNGLRNSSCFTTPARYGVPVHVHPQGFATRRCSHGDWRASRLGMLAESNVAVGPLAGHSLDAPQDGNGPYAGRTYRFRSDSSTSHLFGRWRDHLECVRLTSGSVGALRFLVFAYRGRIMIATTSLQFNSLCSPKTLYRSIVCGIS